MRFFEAIAWLSFLGNVLSEKKCVIDAKSTFSRLRCYQSFEDEVTKSVAIKILFDQNVTPGLQNLQEADIPTYVARLYNGADSYQDFTQSWGEKEAIRTMDPQKQARYYDSVILTLRTLGFRDLALNLCQAVVPIEKPCWSVFSMIPFMLKSLRNRPLALAGYMTVFVMGLICIYNERKNIEDSEASSTKKTPLSLSLAMMLMMALSGHTLPVVAATFLTLLVCLNLVWLGQNVNDMTLFLLGFAACFANFLGILSKDIDTRKIVFSRVEYSFGFFKRVESCQEENVALSPQT